MNETQHDWAKNTKAQLDRFCGKTVAHASSTPSSMGYLDLRVQEVTSILIAKMSAAVYRVQLTLTDDCIHLNRRDLLVIEQGRVLICKLRGKTRTEHTLLVIP